ncbi:hypothetical protein T07_3747, partial [Trichinella nelsoni]
LYSVRWHVIFCWPTNNWRTSLLNSLHVNMIQKYWNSNRIKNFGNVKQHEEKRLEKFFFDRYVEFETLFMVCMAYHEKSMNKNVMSLNGWNWMSQRSTIMTLDSVTR